MEKVLTIVVPTYNMQDYLRRCLDSLIVADNLMNTYEVLIINDGSKDDSLKIAYEYQDRYPATFRVIDKENGNYGSCVNRGLSEAKGKYIKVLDADDWFDKTQFASYLEFLIKLGYEVDMILTPYTKRYANNSLPEIVEPNNIQYNNVYSFSKFDFDKNECSKMIVMHSITYRTALLKNNGYVQDTGISFTDMEYDMIPMLYINSFIFANFKLYQYFLGREGQAVSLDVSSKSIEAYLKIYDTLNRVYLGIKNTNEAVRYSNARIVFYNLLSSLYFVALCFSHKTHELNCKLHEIRSFVKTNDDLLYKKLRRLHVYRIFPIFLIWEKTDFYCSNKVLRRLIKMISSSSKLIKL